jgi:ribosomal protein S18 acetylase RimI-like enzyme
LVLNHEPRLQPRAFSLPLRTLDPLHSLGLRKLIESASTSKEGRVYTYGRQQNPNAVIFHLLSDWDSRHFGVKIAKLGLVRKSTETRVGKPIKVLLRRALTDLDHMKVRCIMSRNDLADLYVVNELERMGFLVKDVLVTFRKELRNLEGQMRTAQELDVRSVKESDIPTIRHIADESFENGHFCRDEKLDRRKSRALYVRWAEMLCSESDHTVLVGTVRDRVIGFIACSLLSEFPAAVIELVGVDRNFRRRGFASALLQHASSLFAPSARNLYAGTQATNIASIATYAAAGFKPAYVETTLHRWSP